MSRFVLILSFFLIIFSASFVKAADSAGSPQADFCDNEANVATVAQEFYNVWKNKGQSSIKVAGVKFDLVYNHQTRQIDPKIEPAINAECQTKIQAKLLEIFKNNKTKPKPQPEPKPTPIPEPIPKLDLKKCVLCVYDRGGSSYLAGETSTVPGENKNKQSLNSYCKSKISKADCTERFGTLGNFVPACRWQEATDSTSSPQAGTCISYFLSACIEELKGYSKEYTQITINDEELNSAESNDALKDVSSCKDVTLLKSGHGEIGGVVNFGERITAHLFKKFPKFRPINLSVMSGGCSDFDVRCNPIRMTKGVCEKVTYYAPQLTEGALLTVLPKNPDDPKESYFVNKYKKIQKTYDSKGNAILQEQLPNCEGRCRADTFDNFSKFRCVKDKSLAFSKWYSDIAFWEALRDGETSQIMCCPNDKRSHEWTQVAAGVSSCPNYDQNKVKVKGNCMADFENLSILRTTNPHKFEKIDYDVSDNDITEAKTYASQAIKEGADKCLAEQQKECEKNQGYKFDYQKQNPSSLNPSLDYFINKDRTFRKFDDLDKTYTLTIYAQKAKNAGDPPATPAIYSWQCSKA